MICATQKKIFYKLFNNFAYTGFPFLKPIYPDLPFSITIFSIMVISIIWIYIVSTDITMKSDINRMMQENIKNVTNTIAEDVRKNGIKWVAPTGDPSCIYSLFPENYKTGTKLCTKSLNEYYLAFENTTNP